MKSTHELPNLPYVGNEKSKMTLHLFLQIIGKIRLKMSPRKNHWWYTTLYVDTSGITTGPVPCVFGTFSITLNIHNHQIEIATSKGDKEIIDLVSKITVGDFYTQLMEKLKILNIEVDILDKPYDLGIDSSFAKIQDYHHYDKNYTHQLWQILLWVDMVFKEFSGRFYGKTCPVHIYWHSFDIAVTRFSGKKAPAMDKEARISDKDAYTHECMSFGFWAGDANMPEPAFYSYTFPSPKEISKEPLKPETAMWTDANGSAMAILKYNDLIASDNPKEQLLQFMESAYQAGAKCAGWDVEKFTVPQLADL